MLLPFSRVKQELIAEFLLVVKENELLHRKLEATGKKIRFKRLDRLFFAALSRFTEKLKSLTLLKPDTVRTWYRNFLKKRWTFPSKKKGGRPRTSQDIRELVLRLKNENISWGYKKIQGELMKLGIELDKNTIARIIREFRKRGKVKTGDSWKNFIKRHLDTAHAMDFFTVGSLFGKSFYVFFIICLKTREIVKCAVTDSPSKFFVEQHLMDWRWDEEKEKVHLIHDRDSMFMGIEYKCYGITGIATSAHAPNMNAIAERFVRSVRKEALDWFIIFNRQQLEEILNEYIPYYNGRRPHQGLEQQTPQGYTPQTEGEVIAFPVLSGLHHHYTRKAS